MDEHRNQAFAYRDLGDGRGIWLQKQIYNWQLSIGRIGLPVVDDYWEYLDGLVAIHSMAEWNPQLRKEPLMWVRHPPTGRRRFPDGDPANEEVRA